MKQPGVPEALGVGARERLADEDCGSDATEEAETVSVDVGTDDCDTEEEEDCVSEEADDCVSEAELEELRELLTES